MIKTIRIPLLFFGITTMAISACFDSGKIASRPEGLAKKISNNMQTSFYSFNLRSLDGQAVSMEQFRGKKIIILNVASKCGYTPQYADWQAFYEANKEEVVVLGFPCNQFFGQEPGSAADIADFCQKNYGVTFPMLEKVNVKGDDKAPIYRWLTDPAENGWNSEEPSWNFCKYVVNEKGELTHFFASKVKPGDEEFLKAMGL
jgi:glutathione peroxidase